jgi:hypothetical protein
MKNNTILAILLRQSLLSATVLVVTLTDKFPLIIVLENMLAIRHYQKSKVIL